jgi:ribose transport system permease protein
MSDDLLDVPPTDAHHLASSPPVRSASFRDRVLQFLESYALLVIMIAIAIFFTFWPATSETFPTVANLRILLASQAVLGLIALGALIPLLCGEFDLSVGALAGLSGVAVAGFMTSTANILGGVLLALAIGLSIGVVNALLVTKARVNGVIATLGISTIISGLLLQVTGGTAPVSNIPQAFLKFGSGTFLGLPRIFLALLIAAGVVYFVLRHTSYGRQIYAVGSNPDAAVLVGLRTKLIIGSSFVLGAVLSALGGLLFVARAGGVSPNVGATFMLPALAAAFLSAAVVTPGRFNVWGTLIAIFFLAVLNNGLSLAGAPQYVSNYVNGAALIAGVALAAALYRRRTH